MDIMEKACGIAEILDVMRGSMRADTRIDRREGRPSDCFVYVMEGTADYFFGERCLSVEPGCILYLPRGGRYHFHVKTEYYHIFIDFNFAPSGMEPMVAVGMQALEGQFRRALRQWLRGSDISVLTCTGILYEIYARMMENCRNRYVSEEGRRLAQRAAEMMLEKLDDRDMRMSDVARCVGISTAHLRRIFHAVHGVSPNSYLQLQRIQRAKRLLLETDGSIEQIAEAAGYCNAYYFGRVFKALTGTPPGTYRMENGR